MKAPIVAIVGLPCPKCVPESIPRLVSAVEPGGWVCKGWAFDIGIWHSIRELTEAPEIEETHNEFGEICP